MGIWNDLLQPQKFWMTKKAPSKNFMQAIAALQHVNSKMSAAEKHTTVVPWMFTTVDCYQMVYWQFGVNSINLNPTFFYNSAGLECGNKHPVPCMDRDLTYKVHFRKDRTFQCLYLFHGLYWYCLLWHKVTVIGWNYVAKKRDETAK